MFETPKIIEDSPEQGALDADTRSLAKGAGVSVVGQGLSRVLYLVNQIILARVIRQSLGFSVLSGLISDVPGSQVEQFSESLGGGWRVPSSPPALG